MFGACASLGSLLTLAAGVLYIFFAIGNFTIHQLVPRHIRILEISTFGLGTALSGTLTGSAQQGFSNSTLYGNPAEEVNQHNPGDGLRTYYTWGLWNRCAGYDNPSNLQYCTSTHWAHRVEPTAALLEDVPSTYRSNLSNLLSSDNDRIKSDKYLGDWSQIAFYFFVVAIALLALMILVGAGSSSGRAAGCASIGLNLLVLGCTLIGTLIWTAMIAIVKNKVNGETISSSSGVSLGIQAQYGNALWILWAINGVLVVSFVPYFFACIRGRGRV